MSADPYGPLANFLQSCVDLWWPVALALAISTIAISLNRSSKP